MNAKILLYEFSQNLKNAMVACKASFYINKRIPLKFYTIIKDDAVQLFRRSRQYIEAIQQSCFKLNKSVRRDTDLCFISCLVLNKTTKIL